MQQPILDVFQAGLTRGVEHMAYDPTKAYFYVEHPTEGWRVYLRAVCFIHEEAAVFDAKRFLVVKRTGAEPLSKSWDPPKGQMEGKDSLKHPRTSIERLLKENVRREVFEEAHVSILHNLTHTGLVLQNREKSYPPNTFFQYHIFHAQTPTPSIQKALAWFAWLKEHPKFFARMSRDKKERDDLRWFHPTETKMIGRWAPSLVAMYVQTFDK